MRWKYSPWNAESSRTVREENPEEYSPWTLMAKPAMSQRDPREILSIFDDLDLDVPEERRIALFALNDYFGAVFAQVGGQLDFRTSDYEHSIGNQWDKASSRLEAVDSVEIPGKYYSTLKTISDLRGDCAHDFRDYPPVEPIESARETAPDWADWIREAADEYEEYQESLTATEALVQVGARALDNTLEDWSRYPTHFAGQAQNLHSQAEDLEAELHSFRDDDEVTKELVEVISDILGWEREKKQFEEKVEAWKQEEAERRERLDRSENSYNFIVVDEAGEYDSIAVVKHEIAEPDHTYTFTISNCPISEKEMEYLRGLEVDDEVHLWIGRTMYRGRNGRIDHDPIIKEVVDMNTSSGNAASATDW